MIKIYIDEKLCKGCKFCVTLCPKKVLVQSDRLSAKGFFPAVAKNSHLCTACRVCERVCPDFAIAIETGKS